MDSEDDISAAEARNTPVSRAGAQLRAAREARNLDLAQVAADTRIPLRHLEAIEAGNFEALPSRAYAIGFSRTFAKAVGLNDVAITDAVRAELADGSMRRTVPSPGMEPGDPARLPSAGLAWAAAAAVLVLAIGIFAWFTTSFGAGTEPGTLLAPAPAASNAPAVAQAAPTPAAAPLANGPVILTALEDGIWLRLYEEGGDRLVERTLKQGEAVTVPPTAADPRINTGRPDALAVTVAGQPVAKLADRPMTLSGMPVSATALAARAAASAPLAATTTAPAPAPAPARRRAAVSRPAAADAPTAAADVPAAQPVVETVPEAEPAAPPRR